MMRYLMLIYMLLATSAAHATQPLVADISTHNITIHSAFDGTDLILFGNRNTSGDIVVVIRGPQKSYAVHKKERVFGIWVNRQKLEFKNVPSFYAMASSRDYDLIEKSIYFDALRIGYREAITPFNLSQYAALDEQARSTREIFSHALLRQLRGGGIYQRDVEPITFIGNTLFRTSIHFPDTTPTGTYAAEVYLFLDGSVVGAHTTPIYIYKSGLDAFVYALATQHPAIYGITAIIIALFGGMLAVKLFDRRN